MPVQEPGQPSGPQYTVCTKLRISVTEGTQAYQPPTVELLLPDSSWEVIYAGGGDGDGWVFNYNDFARGIFEIRFKDVQLDADENLDLKAWLNANQDGAE